MSFINSIGIANPKYKTEQLKIYDYMVAAIPYSDKEQKVLKYLYRKSGIETRYSVLADFGAQNGEARFYNKENNHNPSVENRLSVYDSMSVPLALTAINNCLSDTAVSKDEITHLVTISCTGMSAPGIDTQVIKSMGLTVNVHRFNINFMGCFASISGLKLADTICRADVNAKVLVVSVELCTLHFQNVTSSDYNLSNMLFADGAAAVVVTAEQRSKNAVKIHEFYSEINNEGEQDMSWNISSSGFLMRLSSYVPKLLKNGFKEILEKVMDNYGIDYGDIKYWAIHPGGKRILDNMEQDFQLLDGELDASRGVLKDYGNMSSPTILFVLKAMQQQINISSGEHIFAAAFGPGLTTETALLSHA